MNQNAEAFTRQFTYTICSKSVKASERNTAFRRVHRPTAPAIPAASFPAPQIFLPQDPEVSGGSVTDMPNYLHFLQSEWRTARGNQNRKNWEHSSYNDQISGTGKLYSIWDYHRVFENCSWKAVPQEAYENWVKASSISPGWTISIALFVFFEW